jgi:hypothetical protein
MRNNLDTFTQAVLNAPHLPEAEEHVRTKLEKFAKSCPMHVLVQLGQCVIDCRKEELRQEAERN